MSSGSGTRSCPQCGSSRIVPILRGYPDEAAMRAAERGEAVLGGCILMGDGTDPKWACGECGHELPPAPCAETESTGNHAASR